MTEEYREMRRRLYIRAEGRCEVCGAPLNDYFELAHRIPQRKHLIKKYGKDVIHHPLNLRVTCRGRCNDSVSVGESEEMHRSIIREIMEDGYGTDFWESPY